MVKCPKCETELNINAVADLDNDSRFSMRLCPAPGSKMELRTVGGSLEAMAKLWRSTTKDMGVETILLIDKISTQDDGALQFDLLAARKKKK